MFTRVIDSPPPMVVPTRASKGRTRWSHIDVGVKLSVGIGAAGQKPAALVARTEWSEFAAGTIGRPRSIRDVGLDPWARLSSARRDAPDRFTPQALSLIEEHGRPQSSQNRILPSRLRQTRARGSRQRGEANDPSCFAWVPKLACGAVCDLDFDTLEPVVAAATRVDN
jgi:hypothetical protein